MNKEMSFDRAGFKAYLEERYNCIGYAADIVDSIIDYGHEHEHTSLDMFAYYVSDMLPGVQFEEVAAYCDDAILTAASRDIKKSWKEAQAH